MGGAGRLVVRVLVVEQLVLRVEERSGQAGFYDTHVRVVPAEEPIIHLVADVVEPVKIVVADRRRQEAQQ